MNYCIDSVYSFLKSGANGRGPAVALCCAAIQNPAPAAQAYVRLLLEITRCKSLKSAEYIFLNRCFVLKIISVVLSCNNLGHRKHACKYLQLARVPEFIEIFFRENFLC